MQQRARDERPSLPHGCSTLSSNDVLEQLRLHRVGHAAMYVCLYMHRQTFGNAGFQQKRRARQPGIWCDFSLSEWAAAIPCRPNTLRRIRDDLIVAKIVLFEAGNAGTGRIGWNLDYSAWANYDTRGGARPGAGAPKGNQNARKTINMGEEINQNTGGKSINLSEESINLSEITINMGDLTPAPARNEAERDDAEEWEESLREEETSPNGDGGMTPPVLLFPLNGSHEGDDHTTPSSAHPSPPVARVPSSRKPKYSPEESQWVRLLVEGLETAWGSELPTPKAYRQLGHTLYHRKAGIPEVADVIECWQVTTTGEAFYATQPPTPSQLEKHYSAWVKGRDGYRKAMSEKAARTKAATEGRPQARAAPAQPPPPTYGPAPIVTLSGKA